MTPEPHPPTPAPDEVELASNIGSIKRRGVSTVPRRLLVRSGTGSVTLDFTNAHFHVTGHTGTGSVKARYARRRIFGR